MRFAKLIGYLEERSLLHSMLVRNILAFLLIYSIDLPASGQYEYQSSVIENRTSEKYDLTMDDLDRLYFETKNDPKKVIENVLDYINDPLTEKGKPEYLYAMEVLCTAYSTLEDVVHLKQYASIGLELSKKYKQRNYESIFAAYSALVFAGEKDVQQAEVYSLLSITIAEEVNDARAIGNAHTIYGQVLLEKGDYQKALTHFTLGYEIAIEREDNLSIVSNLSNISVVYSQLGQRQESLAYQEKILSLLDPKDSAMDLSITYYNLGVGYRLLKNHKKSRGYLLQALAISKNIADEVGIAYANYQLALLLYENKEYIQATELISRLLPTFKKFNVTRMVLLTYLIRAKNDSKLQQGEPLNDLREAKVLADKIDTLRRHVNYHETAAEVFVNIDDHKNAVVEFQKLLAFKAQLTKQNNEQAVKDMQARFELLENESDRKLLLKEKELIESKLSQKTSQELTLYLALALAALIALGVGLRLYQQIYLRKRYQSMALKDQLTGVANRRAILLYAEEQLKLASASNQPFTIAILDIDYFKKVNDTYGHNIGDMVLQGFAKACQEGIRESDMVGRYGGEEWLLVMPSASGKSVPPVFRRINESLDSHFDKETDLDIKVRFSLGAAELSSSAKDIKAMIEIADKKLYQAKENGRNQFVV